MSKYRKDNRPEDTIKNITNILKKLDIEVIENTEAAYEGYLYYTRLTIRGLYDIGVNGKGSTELYSRASAYSELMERLFGDLLVQNKFRCSKNINDSELSSTAINRNDIDRCISAYFNGFVENTSVMTY